MSGIGSAGFGDPFRSGNLLPRRSDGASSSGGNRQAEAADTAALPFRARTDSSGTRCHFESRLENDSGRTRLEAGVAKLASHLGFKCLDRLGSAGRIAQAVSGHRGAYPAEWWRQRAPEIQSTAHQLDALRALPALIGPLRPLASEIARAAEAVERFAQAHPGQEAMQELSASLSMLREWLANPNVHRGASADNTACSAARAALLARSAPAADDRLVALAEGHGALQAAWQAALEALAQSALDDAPGPERNAGIEQAMRQLVQVRSQGLAASRDPCLPRFVRTASAFMDRKDPAFLTRLHEMCGLALGKRDPDLAEIAALWAKPSERLQALNAALPGLMNRLDAEQRHTLTGWLGRLAAQLGSTQLLDANDSDIIERAGHVRDALGEEPLDDPMMPWLGTSDWADGVVKRLADAQAGGRSLAPAWQLLNQASQLQQLNARRKPFLAFLQRLVDDPRQLLPPEYQHGILKAVLQQLPDGRLGDSRGRMLDLLDAGIDARLNNRQSANLLAHLAASVTALPGELRDHAVGVLTSKLERDTLAPAHARPVFDMLQHSLQPSNSSASNMSRRDTPGCVLEPTHGMSSTSLLRLLRLDPEAGADSPQAALTKAMTRYLGRALPQVDPRQRSQDSLLPVVGRYIASGVSSPPSPLQLCAVEALCMALPPGVKAADRQKWLELALDGEQAGKTLVGRRLQSLLGMLSHGQLSPTQPWPNISAPARLAAVRMIRSLHPGDDKPLELRRGVTSALRDTVWHDTQYTSAEKGRVALAMLEDAEADQRPMDDELACRLTRLGAASLGDLSTDDAIRAMPVLVQGFHWLSAGQQDGLRAMLQRHQAGGPVAERSVNAAINNLCQFQGDDSQPLTSMLHPLFDQLAEDNKAAVLGDLFDQVSSSPGGLRAALGFMDGLEGAQRASGLSTLLRTVLTDKETLDALSKVDRALATQAFAKGLNTLDARQVADLEREAVHHSEDFPDSPALKAFAELRLPDPAG